MRLRKELVRDSEPTVYCILGEIQFGTFFLVGIIKSDGTFPCSSDSEQWGPAGNNHPPDQIFMRSTASYESHDRRIFWASVHHLEQPQRYQAAWRISEKRTCFNSGCNKV